MSAEKLWERTVVCLCRYKVFFSQWHSKRISWNLSIVIFLWCANDYLWYLIFAWIAPLEFLKNSWNSVIFFRTLENSWKNSYFPCIPGILLKFCGELLCTIGKQLPIAEASDLQLFLISTQLQDVYWGYFRGFFPVSLQKIEIRPDNYCGGVTAY